MQGPCSAFAQDEDVSSTRRWRSPATSRVLKIPADEASPTQGAAEDVRAATTGSRPQLLELLEQIQRKIKKGLPVSPQEVLPSNELRWYMVQTANGFERAVERTIGQVSLPSRTEDSVGVLGMGRCPPRS